MIPILTQKNGIDFVNANLCLVLFCKKVCKRMHTNDKKSMYFIFLLNIDIIS